MKKFLFLFSVLSLSIVLSFTAVSKRIIVIDAGHGGNDVGAKVETAVEKEITLKVAKQIKDLSKGEDFEIVLTRDSDAYPTLEERIQKINSIKPEMVISLHMNSEAGSNSSKKGSEIFFPLNEKSKLLADKLASILGNTKVFDDKKMKILEGDSPSLLLEMGFLSNKKDREYYNSEKGQRETAEKIIKFLKEK